jgi:2-keto-4-pentenoate hydratase/2-oxohepta-3-ene-1,7-dioic acid hydratase in catechol pathway
MRLATVLDPDGASSVVALRGAGYVRLPPRFDRASVRDLAGLADGDLAALRALVDATPDAAVRSLAGVRLGPAVPDPGAIYAIGLNYRRPGDAAGDRPPRPLVYGKLPSSVASPGATLRWDRDLSPSVDAEVELGVVIGKAASGVDAADAVRHVFGYTVIDDVSSRDQWLDGDQWLLGKSMAGFCPVGPCIVTADELDPRDLRLTCEVNSIPIQDGRTADLRFSIAEIVGFLSRHVTLRPGDLIATGTPARLEGPIGPDDHLRPGDVVTCRIEGIGELTTTVA